VNPAPGRSRNELNRRRFLLTLAGAFAAPALAQFPFRRDTLPFPAEALSKLSHWDDPAFLEEWQPPAPNVRMACRAWPGPCELFGTKAHGALAFFDAGKLRSISLLFLDSGAWFGYVPDAQAKAVAATKGSEFLRLFDQVSAAVSQGVAGLGGKPREIALGGKSLLKHTGRVARHGDVWSRLVAWPGQLVKLTLFRDEDAAAQLLAPERRAAKREDQARTFAGLVRTAETGDRVIDHIPLLPQGDRAYCGMSALAMVMQHLGLRIETEELAAAAGIRFGSTQGAKTRETCDAAADVGAMRFDRTQRFDFGRARAALDAGMPVLVFRFWSQERDFIHTAFARRFAADPAATLPKADMNDRKLWPQRGSYAHASIINGYHQARGEVIFTESWAEQSRNRRMRVEEMEGTSYLACYPRLG
jgi:hypothetical protein